MPSASARPAFKIHPVLLAATVIAAVLAIDLDVVRGRGVRRFASRPVQDMSELHLGDSVRYNANGLSYEVIEIWPPSALLQRGDDVIYADVSDLMLDR